MAEAKNLERFQNFHTHLRPPVLHLQKFWQKRLDTVIMEGAGDPPGPPSARLTGCNSGQIPAIDTDNTRPIAPPFPGGIGGLKVGLGGIVGYCTLVVCFHLLFISSHSLTHSCFNS